VVSSLLVLRADRAPADRLGPCRRLLSVRPDWPRHGPHAVARSWYI